MQQVASSFYAFVDGQGGIHVQQLNGTQQIGVSLEKYREMEAVANDALSKADEYHRKLVEAGIIKPVLTMEQQIAALSEQVAFLTQQLVSKKDEGENHEFCGPRKNVSSGEQSMDAAN